jgi:arylsulfatase A
MHATIAALIDHPMSLNDDVAEDSFDVLPAFLGKPHPQPIRSSMILHNGNFAIRCGPWKYIEGKSSPTLKLAPQKNELHAQLYNLQQDPREQNNVIEVHPEIVKRLAALLEKQRVDGRSSRKIISERTPH